MQTTQVEQRLNELRKRLHLNFIAELQEQLRAIDRRQHDKPDERPTTMKLQCIRLISKEVDAAIKHGASADELDQVLFGASTPVAATPVPAGRTPAPADGKPAPLLTDASRASSAYTGDDARSIEEKPSPAPHAPAAGKVIGNSETARSASTQAATAVVERKSSQRRVPICQKTGKQRKSRKAAQAP